MTDHLVEPAYCTTREAAVKLGVSVGTVQSWVEAGRLEAWKTAGGHRRVLRDSVDKLLRHRPVPLSMPQTGGAPALTPERPVVVVVEDDVGLLRLYEAVLSVWPQSPQVLCFDDAVKALLRIGHCRPDLLIFDLNMPGMNGFSLLRSLLTSPEIGTATLAVVTGMAPADIDARGGLPTGVHLHGKPVPFPELLALWNTVLSRRSATQRGTTANA